MIEKLKVVIKPEDWKLPVNELEMRCLKNLLLKIDELVDTINELQERVDDHDQAFDDCARDVTKIETMLKNINTTNSKMENVAENWECSKMEQNETPRCPFCQQELVREGSNNYWCKKCNLERHSPALYGSKKLWQELIRTRKALEVAVDALKYANKCIKGGCVNWETEIDKALEQITALEQKD